MAAAAAGNLQGISIEIEPGCKPFISLAANYPSRAAAIPDASSRAVLSSKAVRIRWSLQPVPDGVRVSARHAMFAQALWRNATSQMGREALLFGECPPEIAQRCNAVPTSGKSSSPNSGGASVASAAMVSTLTALDHSYSLPAEGLLTPRTVENAARTANDQIRYRRGTPVAAFAPTSPRLDEEAPWDQRLSNTLPLSMPRQAGRSVRVGSLPARSAAIWSERAGAW